MEADGDPSTFNINLRLLRPADGNTMKLVKYGFGTGATAKNHGVGVTNEDITSIDTTTSGGGTSSGISDGK